MIKFFLILAIGGPSQIAPISESEKISAAIAFRAAIDAIDTRKMEVVCYPNSLYRDDEPCDAPEKNAREFDLRKLVYFKIERCGMDISPTKCAMFLFDRGRGDGGVTTLELATDSGVVRTAADIKTISISQFILPRD